jgi:2-pyrone-4,6-dicarboxylate lactonase
MDTPMIPMTTDATPTDSAPQGAAPAPYPRAPSFAVPPGAVDTHAHVVGLPPQWPLAVNRSYTPVESPVEDYLAMLDATRMTYGVLIQVSVHGTNNGLMMDALKAYPGRLRGVAVVDPDVPGRELDRELDDLAASGVSALRLNVLFGGGIGLEAMTKLGPRCAERGLHLQFLMDVRALAEMEETVRALPVPVVIDHMGHIPVSEGTDHPGFQALLSLLRDGKAWAKLSGAYRISSDAPHFPDATPFAQAIVEANPEHCLWGSDWPHVGLPTMPFNTGDLLDQLPVWVPDETTRNRILVDNPARLFGFPPAA